MKVTKKDIYLVTLRNLASKLFPGALSLGCDIKLVNLLNKYEDLYDSNITSYTDTAYRRDVRSNSEKLVDLLQGFFLEDLVCMFASKRRIPLRINQSEEGRTVQNLNDIVETDFSLKVATRVVPIEFKSIHHDIAETGFRIKLSNWERYKKERALILGYEVVSNRFFIIDPNNRAYRTKSPEPFKGWGNKLCIKFVSSDLDFIPHNKLNTKNFIDFIV
jgi:hypothetical protein